MPAPLRSLIVLTDSAEKTVVLDGVEINIASIGVSLASAGSL